MRICTSNAFSKTSGEKSEVFIGFLLSLTRGLIIEILKLSGTTPDSIILLKIIS